ncbi:MAG: hypothetical protein ABFS18_09505 [Thermodesulfobacteriota bacterium]
MRTDPDKSTLLGGAAMLIGAAGCAMVCFRVARLMVVAQALARRKRAKDETRPAT